LRTSKQKDMRETFRYGLHVAPREE
jgi:hypothetical protein